MKVRAPRAESARDLAVRFEDRLRSTSLLPQGAALTVALSGGLDSVVLLDLLQGLEGRWGWKISAAHFDHRMRDESGADADWVRALCQERDVPLLVGHARRRPDGEAEARELRYEFLLAARHQLGADWLVTAHQADDQAETVLFRMLRGSGLAGLAGIPERRQPGIVRPLLPFWRSEIAEYARSKGLSYLDDPSNLDLSIARNRIRHELIPTVEASGCPDLRTQLHQLAGLAERAARVVERLAQKAADELVLETAESRIVVARAGFLAYDTNVRAHLLRVLAARIGPRPGRVGTRTALEFINTGRSGRRIDLPGGIVVRREFDHLIFERRACGEPAVDEVLVLSGPRSGEAEVTIAGARWRVRWRLEVAEEGGERAGGAGGAGAAGVGGASDVHGVAHFALRQLHFPLTVRSWRPGDRIGLPAGGRKLKKLFVDRRVGRSQRGKYPVLSDSAGILWVVGLAQGTRAAPGEGDEVLFVCVRREG